MISIKNSKEKKPTIVAAKTSPPQKVPSTGMVPPSVMPQGMDPKMAQQNLQKLAQNPGAMAALREMFGGGKPPAGDQGGLEPLYDAMANSITCITRASDRTMKELDEARAEIVALKADAELWRKQEEAKKFVQATDHAAKIKIQTALENIVGIAHEKGGNEMLGEAMIELAQTAGVPLTPEQIDTLSGATKQLDRTPGVKS